MSYLLIIYLQGRRKSGRGRVNAVMSNRIRDAMLLVMLYGRMKRNLEERNIPRVRSMVVVMTMIGKSARGLMTSWLIGAMERPTPVSSLLHSSTIVIARLIRMLYIRGMQRIRILRYGILWGVVITGRGIRGMSKTKVVVARSTRVHIRVMMRGLYLGEYGIVGLHMGIHRIVKVYGFVICGVISHNQVRRLDSKRGGRRRGRRKVRVGGGVIGAIRLMR